MTATSTATALSASALLLLALVGCAPGTASTTDDPGTDTGTGTETETDTGSGTDELAGDADTACLARTWNLDTADLAAQLGASLGPNVTQSEANGTQTFTFDADGGASATIDVTYTITIEQDDIAITVVQTHAGAPSGRWQFDAADPGVVTFDGWDNSGYSIQNSVLINGTATDSPIELPEDDLGETGMTVDCAGDTLSTQVQGSPFTQHWTASS